MSAATVRNEQQIFSPDPWHETGKTWLHTGCHKYASPARRQGAAKFNGPGGLMQWHKIRVPYDQILDVRIIFDGLFLAAGSPPNAALLVRNRWNFSEAEIYFSPEAYSIANFLVFKFSGTPCNPPDQTATVLCGRLREPASPRCLPARSLTVAA